MKEMILFFTLIITFNLFQQSSAAYPQIGEDNEAGDLSLFDGTLNYRRNTTLFNAREEELNAILNSARLKAERATDQDVMAAGISPKGAGDVSAKELLKIKIFEKLVFDRNLDLIRKMNSLPLSQSNDPTKVIGLTEEQIMATAETIEFTPATDSRKSLKQYYDPDRDWGYCFLRAHYYAGAVEQRGLDMNSVRKVFLVGRMKLFGTAWNPFPGWQYHVATAVRGINGKWYVLDNHLGKNKGRFAYAQKAYTVEEWFLYYEKYLNTPENMISNSAYDGSTEKINAKGLFLYFTAADRVTAAGDAYTKGRYYGIDRNKNGKFERREMFFNGAFVDVDNFLSVPIHRCSSERYRPLPPTSPQCQNLTSTERQQFENRKVLVEKWRLESSFENDQNVLPTY